MLVEASEKTATSGAVYPFVDVQNLLLIGVGEALEEIVDLRGEWEPLIDSLRVVSVLVSLEDLFDFPLPPEKLVRAAGTQAATMQSITYPVSCSGCGTKNTNRGGLS